MKIGRDNNVQVKLLTIHNGAVRRQQWLL
jgi:hypothetical protein